MHSLLKIGIEEIAEKRICVIWTERQITTMKGSLQLLSSLRKHPLVLHELAVECVKVNGSLMSYDSHGIADIAGMFC